MDPFQWVAKDGLTIHGTFFRVDDPKGLVQIIHGAKEHRGRYEDFAKFLQRNGFAVIIFDNCGHGESISSAIKIFTFSWVSRMTVLISASSSITSRIISINTLKAKFSYSEELSLLKDGFLLS